MKALALLVLAACNGGKPPQPTEAPVEPTPVEPAPVEPAAEPAPADAEQATKPTSPAPWGDSYAVMATPTLSGVVLTVDVRYGGGCEEHVFTPSGARSPDGAQTTQAFVLVHDANDDHCRAIKYQTVTVDLGDYLDADCLTTILLITPPGDDNKGEYLLPLAKPQGCD